MYDSLFRNALFPAYETLVKRRGTASHVAEYEHNQWLGPRELQALQLRKLNELLAHCWAQVPFLQRHWREHGVAPGALGSSEASLTKIRSLPNTWPNESAPQRPRCSPSGTVEQRCTVITLALVAAKRSVRVARSARPRTTGAPRNEGYTSVAPASSIKSASRASPLRRSSRSRWVRR